MSKLRLPSDAIEVSYCPRHGTRLLPIQAEYMNEGALCHRYIEICPSCLQARIEEPLTEVYDGEY